MFINRKFQLVVETNNCASGCKVVLNETILLILLKVVVLVREESLIKDS